MSAPAQGPVPPATGRPRKIAGRGQSRTRNWWLRCEARQRRASKPLDADDDGGFEARPPAPSTTDGLRRRTTWTPWPPSSRSSERSASASSCTSTATLPRSCRRPARWSPASSPTGRRSRRRRSSTEQILSTSYGRDYDDQVAKASGQDDRHASHRSTARETADGIKRPSSSPRRPSSRSRRSAQGVVQASPGPGPGRCSSSNQYVEKERGRSSRKTGVRAVPRAGRTVVRTDHGMAGFRHRDPVISCSGNAATRTGYS